MMEPSRFIRFLGRLRLIYLLRFRGIRLGSRIHLDVSGKFYYGKGCSVGRNATIVVPSSGILTIGNYCYFGRNIEVGSGGVIDIGDRTSLQDRCILLGNVKIGANCTFSYNVYASSGRHQHDLAPYFPIKYQDRNLSLGRYQSEKGDRPIIIGDDCFIGINVVIMPGVTIGNGAIVGSNSVVLKNVKPYTIVVGSPAREIKSRLDFQPPRLIDSSIDAHYPYFYSGFEIGENFIYTRDIRGGFVCKKNFTLALELCGAKSIHLEFEPSYFKNLELIMNSHYRVKVKNNIEELVFTVNSLDGHFLFFEINNWECMKPLILKKAWVE
jgi:acetyltransferase-like isoleucine patch superfamily enzyme